MLRARVLSIIFLAPLLLLVAYLGDLAWLIAVLISGIQAWREIAKLLRQRVQFTLDRTLGLFFVVGAVLEAYVHATNLITVDLLRPLLTGLIIFSLIWALYKKGDHPTEDWGVTVASAIYLGFLLGHFVTLREGPNGRNWVWLAFGLTWITDVTAYVVGSAIGKHKLWPRISPKKTWEGLAGGSLAVIVAGPLLGGWLVGLAPWQGVLLGALVAAAGAFGDFAVSLFKRHAHTKDSSHLIPGHGGLLDRMDSLLFVFPMVTYFAVFVAGR